MSDYALKRLKEKYVPKDKDKVSVDLLDVLMKMAYEEGRKDALIQKAEDDFEDKHGPRFI